MSELERIERQVQELKGLLLQVMAAEQKNAATLQRIEQLLEPPAAYPQSSGGTITVR